MSMTILKSVKSLLMNLAEFGIITVSAAAALLWYCAKKTKIGPIIRDSYFRASERLKRYKS
jgi:hypothetical protein